MAIVAAYRISKARFAANAFDGTGARRAGGRWNSRGTSVVYTSETRALAAIELLAHLEAPARGFVIIDCSFDESLVQSLPLTALVPGWNEPVAPAALADLGDEWVRIGASAVLKVPSAVVNGESNYLLNPAHRDFAHITIGVPEPFLFDRRLVSKLKRR